MWLGSDGIIGVNRSNIIPNPGNNNLEKSNVIRDTFLFMLYHLKRAKMTVDVGGVGEFLLRYSNHVMNYT